MNVREMYNYGYKWTGMIPLTAEEARNLFLNDSIQIYRLYQDNTESSVESLEEISAPYLYGILFLINIHFFFQIFNLSVSFINDGRIIKIYKTKHYNHNICSNYMCFI